MARLLDLKNIPKAHDFFIGFDSDGCIFDSMEIKQKECFCPAFIKHFHLQVVSKYAREVWEFVNLYSKTRGCNRFKALVAASDLLAERAEVQARQAKIPAFGNLRAWVKVEKKLSNSTLKAKVDTTGDAEMKQIYAWSLEVNERIEDLVHDLPPFPGVVAALEQSRQKADIIVVSQTPLEALLREWADNKIDHLVKAIAGQEQGTKAQHLAFGTGGRYQPDRILMVGDAPGDYDAARDNKALFFPIVPGHEERSWQAYAAEGLGRFFAGTFAGEYQQRLLAEFDDALPAKPRW